MSPMIGHSEFDEDYFSSDQVWRRKIFTPSMTKGSHHYHRMFPSFLERFTMATLFSTLYSYYSAAVAQEEAEGKEGKS
jgi:hypothetical protein